MKNPFSKNNLSQSKGYTLLFSVIVATLVLSVAAFILSISRKQFVLSSAARDSTYAFYAADSGIECAVLHYRKGEFATSSNYFNGTPGTTVTCGGKDWTAVPSTAANAPYTDTIGSIPNVNATTTFFMATGVGGRACAWVKVGFNTGATGKVVWIIESRGYNIGWNTTQSPNDCSDYGPRKVERALRLTYR